MTWMAWMWLALTLVCIIVEIVTMGVFFILFAAGTLVAFVVSLFVGNIAAQVITFAIVSLLCLLFLRPIIRRWLRLGKYGASMTIPDSIEQNIGKTGVVIRDIDGENRGQVKVGGEVWTAKTAVGIRIPAGTEVRVKAIEGVTAVVEVSANQTGDGALRLGQYVRRRN